MNEACTHHEAAIAKVSFSISFESASSSSRCDTCPFAVRYVSVCPHRQCPQRGQNLAPFHNTNKPQKCPGSSPATLAIGATPSKASRACGASAVKLAVMIRRPPGKGGLDHLQSPLPVHPHLILLLHRLVSLAPKARLLVHHASLCFGSASQLASGTATFTATISKNLWGGSKPLLSVAALAPNEDRRKTCFTFKVLAKYAPRHLVKRATNWSANLYVLGWDVLLTPAGK